MKANKIEFVEDGHYYLNENGVIIPSVSEVVNFAFPKKYANIPQDILDKKAEFGNKIHSIVENSFFQKNDIVKQLASGFEDDDIKHCVNEFERLDLLDIEMKDSEQLGTYKGLVCGTYDLMTMQDEIIDIKTTSKLMIDNETLQAPLNLQISLYNLIFNTGKNYGYVLWLPKKLKGKFEKVKCWKKKDLLKLIDEFRKENGYL